MHALLADRSSSSPSPICRAPNETCDPWRFPAGGDLRSDSQQAFAEAGLERWTFQKAADAQLAVMHEDAVRLVRANVVQSACCPRERHFEGSYHDVPVMPVDNSLDQFVTVLYCCGENDAPCIVPMLPH